MELLTLDITHSTISGNAASYHGGGICNDYSTLNITNSNFSGNSAYYGGAISTYHDTLAVTNSTIAGNSADSYGGGIRIDSGTVTAQNSIVALNDAPTDPDVYGTLELESSHNIIGPDPGFVAADDFHLAPGSSAINAGSNALVPGDLTSDLDGNPRIVGPSVDIGAYEFQYPLVPEDKLPGDANLDGVVNEDDAAILADNWGMSGMSWRDGDFSGDGQVGAIDACIMAANWGATFTPPGEEETSPGGPAPSAPATPVDRPLVGPVQASPARVARRLIEPVAGKHAPLDDRSVGQAVPDARPEETAAAYDAVLVEEYGPQVKTMSLQRRRLAFSHALARRQTESQEDSADDKTALAVDLLLKCEM